MAAVNNQQPSYAIAGAMNAILAMQFDRIPNVPAFGSGALILAETGFSPGSGMIGEVLDVGI